MARYFFDIADGVDIKDDFGRDIDGSAEDVRAAAFAAAQRYIANLGTQPAIGRLEVHDDLGNLLLALRFEDVKSRGNRRGDAQNLSDDEVYALARSTEAERDA